VDHFEIPAPGVLILRSFGTGSLDSDGKELTCVQELYIFSHHISGANVDSIFYIYLTAATATL